MQTVDFALTPIRDKFGVVDWLILEGSDITDVRRLEAERNDLQQRLHHSERLDSIGRLTGGIAHDFNNELTVLCAGLEMPGAEEDIEPLNLERDPLIDYEVFRMPDLFATKCQYLTGQRNCSVNCVVR